MLWETLIPSFPSISKKAFDLYSPPASDIHLTILVLNWFFTIVMNHIVAGSAAFLVCRLIVQVLEEKSSRNTITYLYL